MRVTIEPQLDLLSWRKFPLCAQQRRRADWLRGHQLVHHTVVTLHKPGVEAIEHNDREVHRLDARRIDPEVRKLAAQIIEVWHQMLVVRKVRRAGPGQSASQLQVPPRVEARVAALLRGDVGAHAPSVAQTQQQAVENAIVLPERLGVVAVTGGAALRGSALVLEDWAEILEDWAQIPEDWLQVFEDWAQILEDWLQILEDPAQTLESWPQIVEDWAQMPEDSPQILEKAAQNLED